MLNTARYVEIDGKRVLRRFGVLHVDPVATRKNALRHVCSKAVKVAREMMEVAEYNRVPYADHKTLKKAYEAERATYSEAVERYGRDNPIHFGPRANEVVLCPLLFNGQS